MAISAIDVVFFIAPSVIDFLARLTAARGMCRNIRHLASPG
jgi:hypothetical protein